MSGWAAAGSAAASMGGNALEYGYQRNLAKRARDWQEKMYSRMHQVEVADLEAAGLNPILSSAHSSSMPNASGGGSVSGTDLGRSMMSGMATAQQMKESKANVELKKEDIRSKEMEVRSEAKMYDWLEKNPKLKDMFYSSMLAKRSGMNPSIYAPLLGMSSAGTKSRVQSWVDKLFGSSVRKHYGGIGKKPIVNDLFPKKERKKAE